MTPSFRQRVLDYATIIPKLNDARVAHKDFPIVDEFAKLSKSVDSDRIHDRNLDIWKLLSNLATVTESNDNKNESQKKYSQLQQDDPKMDHMTRQLIAAAKNWLEKE